MAATATRKKKRSRSRAAARDVYQDVTDRIVEALEAGVVPWHQPWKNLGGPRNLNSGRGYRGINPFLLQIEALAKGYSDPRWATFNGIREKGGMVRKGQHGTRITFWRRWQVDDKDNEGEKKTIMLIKDYTVFNVEQADFDPPLAPVATLEDYEPVAEAEAIVAGYDGPEIQHGGDRAYYSPPRDLVGVPEMGAFESVESYYAALFHELTHSTGHEDRLDRLDKSTFGSEPYAKEELVAELGAAMLVGVTGIEANHEANASYIANWMKAIRDDKKLIVSAAAQAQKGADLICGTTFGEKEEDE